MAGYEIHPLEKARRISGLSRAKAAEIIGVSYSEMKYLERVRQHQYTLPRISRLFKALNDDGKRIVLAYVRSFFERDTKL